MAIQEVTWKAVSGMNICICCKDWICDEYTYIIVPVSQIEYFSNVLCYEYSALAQTSDDVIWWLGFHM